MSKEIRLRVRTLGAGGHTVAVQTLEQAKDWDYKDLAGQVIIDGHPCRNYSDVLAACEEYLASTDGPVDKGEVVTLDVWKIPMMAGGMMDHGSDLG